MMSPKKAQPPQPEPGQPPQKRGRKAKTDTASPGGRDEVSVPTPDAYLVKVQDALSLILGHPVFHKIADAKPLSIKPEGKKGGGGWKVLTTQHQTTCPP